MQLTNKIEASHRDNNFDILRLVAAYLVLFSHSFPLYDNSKDPLYALTGQVPLTTYALAMFFIISGYLIPGSYLRHKNSYSFAVARLVRILPGLAVVLILSVFVLGPLMTNLTITEYFSSSEAWKYLRGILIIPLEYDLPGVFDNNAYQYIVNGSLWSLEIEVKCYILVAIFGAVSLLKPRFVIYFSALLLLIFLICNGTSYAPKRVLGVKFLDIRTYSQWIYYFFAGTSFYLMREKVKYDQRIFYSFILLNIVVSASTMCAYLVFMLTLPYIILYMANAVRPVSGILKGTDISYGMYIYAFPIQQVYMALIGTKYGFLTFLCTCSVLSIFFGYISWRLIEKPCLKLKIKNV